MEDGAAAEDEGPEVRQVVSKLGGTSQSCAGGSRQCLHAGASQWRGAAQGAEWPLLEEVLPERLAKCLREIR